MPQRSLADTLGKERSHCISRALQQLERLAIDRLNLSVVGKLEHRRCLGRFRLSNPDEDGTMRTA